LATLGGVLRLRHIPPDTPKCCRGFAFQLADGSDYYPPMPKQDADIFEVLISQMGESRNINPVLSKAFGVLGHAELFEPVRNMLHGGPADLSHDKEFIGKLPASYDAGQQGPSRCIRLSDRAS
jgi:hypothetical protein